ncbi:beta-ketoacyl synthase chain length factor [Curvivirga sp.]|uniref:beta-ketoacyl synthase chain length factor n=1 Tax=Curvivirga sp. TaxID=2856848 RepID=UPI003B594927
MTDFSISILDWSAWAPGFEKDSDWTNFDTASLEGKYIPEVKELPMIQRRRLNRLGRMAMRVAKDVEPHKNHQDSEQCIILNENTHLVFSSRYGDICNTLKLLTNLSIDGDVSPTNFSFSVHNALAGFYSINTKNILPHTAVSAGENSFEHAMLEAMSLILEDSKRDVLLVHYDEPLPEFYSKFQDETVKPLALAVRLAAKNTIGQSINVLKQTQDVEAKEDNLLSFVKFLSGIQETWKWSIGSQHWTLKKPHE